MTEPITHSIPTELTPEDQKKLANIALNKVYEPYEFYLTAQTLQSAGVHLGKTLSGLKSVQTDVTDYVRSGTTTLGNYAKTLSEKISRQYDEFSENTSFKKVTGEFHLFFDETAGKVKQAVKNMPKTNSRLKQYSVDSWQRFSEKLPGLLEQIINKILSGLVQRYTVEFILENARKTFPEKNILSTDDILQLSEAERKKLLSQYQLLKIPYWESFSSVALRLTNLFLGITSQIPLAGVAIGLVNMVKTLLLVSKSICDYSAVYGKVPASVESLHFVSFSVLQSMNDFEINSAHTPLDFMLIESLYDPDIRFKINGVFKQIVLKDAYISIPVIGFLSIKKIDFDDFKQELNIRHLFDDYFGYRQLLAKYGLYLPATLLEENRQHYRMQKTNNPLQKIKATYRKKGNKLAEYIFENHEFAAYAREKMIEALLEENAEQYLSAPEET